MPWNMPIYPNQTTLGVDWLC